MNKAYYPTNLTEKQWQVIENFLDPKKRKRKYELRSIVNAIFYLLKTGCHWRMLPNDFAPWSSVYSYFRKWKYDGTFEELNDILRSFLRQRAGKKESPSLGIIDSRSVRTSSFGALERGIDGNKKIKGRKQHIIVDTMGLLMVVMVHAANIYDGKAAFAVIERLKFKFPRLVKILADGGYRGEELAGNIKSAFGWVLEVVLRSDNLKKFKVIPKRWIVERTFSWFENYRRLSKDFERQSDTVEAMIQIAMVRLMLNRIK
jgi:putative transposase